jgi:hypothetical protein
MRLSKSILSVPFLVPLFKARLQLEQANPGDRSGH